MEFAVAFARLKSVLAQDGIRAALAFLNGLTPHRFTALFRFDDKILRNVCFYDSEQPDIQGCADIPVTDSYCVFVRDEGRVFTVIASLSDDRVSRHSKRVEVQSYCGVPLLDENGRMFGSICHFDFRPMSISDENVALMEKIAPLLNLPADVQVPQVIF
jgi:GAF domain-containing protein